MEHFRLQESLYKSIRKNRPGMADGMHLVTEKLSSSPGGDAWEHCRDIPWDRGLESWIAWFDGLLNTHHLPENTELLWFEVPSELNPALTSVSAYEQLGPADEDYGLEEDRTWPQDDEGDTLPAALHDLPELEDALVRSGWREHGSPTREQLRPGVYALLHSYTSLLVINGLPRTSLLNSQQSPKGVSVVIGWSDGDVDPIGQLVDNAWKPIRKVRA